MTEFGGFIGSENSILDRYSTYFELFRLHAGFHDAFGFMKSNYNWELFMFMHSQRNPSSQTVYS